MSKVNLPPIPGGYISLGALNSRFGSIEAAFDNTLSRDGALPNSMEADLDMNSNSLLNVDTIHALKYEGLLPENIVAGAIILIEQATTDSIISITEASVGDAGAVAFDDTSSVLSGADVQTALEGLGSAAIYNDARYNHRANNLSDVDNVGSARNNIGANDASNLTTGTLPLARLGTFYDETTVNMGGDFTGDGSNVHLRRVGNLVVAHSDGAPTHSSANAVSGAPGAVPAGFRPYATAQIITGPSGGSLSRFYISSAGTFSVIHFSITDGLATEETVSKGPLNTSWVVA